MRHDPCATSGVGYGTVTVELAGTATLAHSFGLVAGAVLQDPETAALVRTRTVALVPL